MYYCNKLSHRPIQYYSIRFIYIWNGCVIITKFYTFPIFLDTFFSQMSCHYITICAHKAVRLAAFHAIAFFCWPNSLRNGMAFDKRIIFLFVEALSLSITRQFYVCTNVRLVRLLNLSFDVGVVPMDWRGACIEPLYTGKGDKCECSNSRGINLLSVVGKLFGRVLIKRVRAGTEFAIREEQCGFRQGRGCIYQVIAARQVCEKYLANGKDVFWAFMDLEKAYDTINRHGMWQMLRVYGV